MIALPIKARFKRVDIKKLLANPVLKKELMVRVIVATQLREGIVTTIEEANRAYERALCR